MSASVVRAPSSRSSTWSTPSARSSWSSGTAISARGHVTGLLGDVSRKPRVVAEILEHEGLAGHEDPAGDPGARRNPRPDERTGALTGDRLEDELVGVLVVQEDRRRLGTEDRLRGRDDRVEQRAVLLLARQDPGGDDCMERIAHGMPPTLAEVR